MISDIKFIAHFPFTKRDYDRFGIELLQQQFRVEVLDCMPWLNPKSWDEFSNTIHTFPGYTPIYNMDSFEKVIAVKERAVAIDCFGYSSVYPRICQALRERGIMLAVCRMALLPKVKMDLFRKLYFHYKRGVLVKLIINKLRSKIYIDINSRPPDIAILSGKDSLSYPRMQHAEHIIWGHSFDYDLYLRYQDRTGERCKQYAVFLDDYLAYHSDYAQTGINPPVTEEDYYYRLNKFLKFFESNTGYKVIFAAHPSSRYDLKPHLLDGREFVLGRTAELVRDAQIVFCHASTSLSFAVLWHKPLVFLTTDELKRSWFGPSIAFFSNILHAPIVNMSCIDKLSIDMKVWMRINESYYAEYKENFIKRSGSPELPVWQIFSNYVRQNLK